MNKAKKKNLKIVLGIALVILVAGGIILYLGFRPLNIANYTPTSGTACWHIDGNWSYIWYSGGWDYLVPAENRKMTPIDPAKGIRVIADSSGRVLYDQWQKSDGCYTCSNCNVEFWASEGAITIDESSRPYLTGTIYDSSTIPAITLPGATVMFEGKQVVTDANGRYTILLDHTTPQNIIVSMSGFKSFQGMFDPQETGSSSFDVGLDKIITCVPAWICTDYGACTSGSHVRICTDGCGSSHSESQVCAEQPPYPVDPSEETGCAADAKVCPDGSSVGRVDPDCEFAPCPAPQPGQCNCNPTLFANGCCNSPISQIPTPGPPTPDFWMWILVVAIIVVAALLIVAYLMY